MSTDVNNVPTVRTYRGRSLEELIPRIRAELGDDAIILREREGVTGGLNGFFAQRCVEVDARAATGIDFYDDDAPAHPGVEPDPDPALADPGPQSALAGPGRPQALADPGAHQALAGPGPQPALAGPGPQPALAPDSDPGPSAPEPDSGPSARDRDPAPSASAPGEQPSEELSFAERLAVARQEREVRTPAPEPAAPAEAFAPASATPAPSGPVHPLADAGRDAGAAGRGAGAAAQLDAAAAGAVARELIGRGVSEAWAHELIVAAAAHLTPFAPQGSLRDGARTALARSIPVAPPLPSSGAAVAFVGAGGAGKSRAAAAMAAAYRQASALRVSVLSVQDSRRGADIKTLLDGRGVPVRAVEGEAAVEGVDAGRERGLVVIDTGTTSPVDAAAVGRLAAELGRLALDAVYLTLPATLSAAAARSLLDGLAPLAPTAVVISHADETDALGIAVELAYLSGLPIAFVHGVLRLDGALIPADSRHLAARLLP